MAKKKKRPSPALSKEEKLLIILRDELYEGSWDELRKDLDARLDGKPYIFKLAERLEEDLERIERLQQYEIEHGINLRNLVPDLEEWKNV